MRIIGRTVGRHATALALRCYNIGVGIAHITHRHIGGVGIHPSFIRIDQAVSIGVTAHIRALCQHIDVIRGIARRAVVIHQHRQIDRRDRPAFCCTGNGIAIGHRLVTHTALGHRLTVAIRAVTVGIHQLVNSKHRGTYIASLLEGNRLSTAGNILCGVESCSIGIVSCYIDNGEARVLQRRLQIARRMAARLAKQAHIYAYHDLFATLQVVESYRAIEGRTGDEQTAVISGVTFPVTLLVRQILIDQCGSTAALIDDTCVCSTSAIATLHSTIIDLDIYNVPNGAP